MASKKNIQPPKETIKRSPKYLDNEMKFHLMKDFQIQVSQSDFLSLKEELNQNFGILGDVISLMHKNNKKIYYLKTIEKKNIIHKSYQNILNIIYKLNILNNNIINLQTQWENNEKLFLIFDGIKKYILLDNLIKNDNISFNEDCILAIYKQILEYVKMLHDNNIYGCNFNLNTFIYDTELNTIKLTDLGFSKIFKSLKNINDNKLQNGFEFNEYIPPEFINKMNDPQNINNQDKLKNSSYDIWQLGILFYKIATNGKSPYNNVKDEE